jgi:hypothetical protein
MGVRVEVAFQQPEIYGSDDDEAIQQAAAKPSIVAMLMVARG